jgi:hypothetical protein
MRRKEGFQRKMSSQPGAPEAPSSGGGGGDSRLHIRAITEMPAGHDTELGLIFQEMRRAADVSREQIAGRLATPLETIEALESGALLALPEWSELTRIVTAYTALLGLDARPILRRMEGQLGQSKPAPVAQTPVAPASAPPVPPTQKTATPASANASGLPIPPSAKAPPEPLRGAPLPPGQTPPQPPSGAFRPQPAQGPATSHQPQASTQPQAPLFEDAAIAEPEDKPKGRMAGLVKTLLNWVVLIGFVAVLGSGLWYAAKHPRMVWSGLDALPQPISSAVRRAWNFMRPLDNEPARPQQTDPDNRKSDKLS